MFFLFNVAKAATDALRMVGSFLCKAIYWLIANLYELFMNLSSVQFLQQDSLKPIYQRVTLILSIIMVFYVTFQTVKYIIDPDTITDKEQGASNVVKRMIIVVVLIAMVPQLFSLAYTLQNSILKNQIFSKIILGKEQVQVSTFGRSFSSNVLSMFYFVDGDFWDDPENVKCGSAKCQTIVDMNLSTLQSNGTLTYLEVGLTEQDSYTDPSGTSQKIYGISFEWLLAVAVGGFIGYMLILYCIDTGTRVAHLAFLQIIAPIPIISYLAPKKEGMFEKWYKQCFAVYLSIFLRVGIIYIVLFIADILGDAYRNKTLLNGMSNNTWMNIFMYIALIVGLLAFAKKAPKMIEEIFPSMSSATGNLGLSMKDRIEGATDFIKGTGKVAKGAGQVLGTGRRLIGTGGAFAAGLVSGRGFKGAVEAAKAGWDKENKGLLKGSIFNRIRRGANAGAKVRQNRADIIDAGGTVYGAEHRQEHYQNMAQQQDREVNNLEGAGKKKETINSSINGIKVLKQLEAMKKAAESSGNDSEARRLENEIKKVQKASRAYAQSRRTGNATDQAARLDELRAALGSAVAGTTMASDLATDADRDAALEIGSAKWATVETYTADGVASVTSPEMLAMIGEEYITIKAPDGSDTPITINDLVASGPENVARYIGDIADVAESVAARKKTSEEYRRAHANAKGAEGNKGSSS